MSIASKLAELVIKKGGTLSADEDSVEEILAKLIELEDGGGDILVAKIVSDAETETLSFDKTASEMLTAAQEGKLVIQYVESSVVNPVLLQSCGMNENTYVFVVIASIDVMMDENLGTYVITGTPYMFIASSGSDYPQQTDII